MGGRGGGGGIRDVCQEAVGLLHEVCLSRFPLSTENQAIFFVHVVRVHFYFNGLPDEAIRVTCFYGE